MGDRNSGRVIPENVDGPSADALQPRATQAQALTAQGQALAAQAQAPAVPAVPAQAVADQVEAPAARAQAFAAQALALAAQAQALATQVQALLATNNDMEAVEKSVHAYKVIANLYDINLHYPIHKLALEDWERTEKYLSNRVARRESRISEVTNQLYNIIGWFGIFLGVVLIAVSQLTQTAQGEPLCGKIWFPIVLTGFGLLGTLVGILHKFATLQSLESTIHAERQAQIEVAKRAICLRREGPQKFKFNLDTNNSLSPTKARPFRKSLFWVIVFLLIFTCIFILSYFVILCDTGVVRQWDGGLHR